jgi:NPCBM-associated, NEW3 domain of alpha-galactosidase
MAASAFISVDPTAIQIQAGGHASARVTVLNRGDNVGQYVLDIQGLEPSWGKLEPQQLGIFPADSAAVQLQLHPPQDSASATFQVLIRAVNQVDPADLVQAVLNLTVQRTGEPAIPPDVSAKPAIAPSPSTNQRPAPSPARKPAVKPPTPAQAAIKVSSTTGQVQLTSDLDGLKVLAGSTQSLNLGLSNSGGVALNMELQVKGPPMSWLSLSPGATLALAPGETSTTTLSISIPTQAPLGTYPLTILALGVDDASITVRLNLMLEVIKLGDIMLVLDPPQKEGEVSAEFNVLLSQTGQAPVTVNLSGRDDSGRLGLSFSPATVSIPAGGNATSRLIVQSQQSLTEVESQMVPFVVTASPVDGMSEAANTQGRMVMLRAAPGRLVLQPDEQRDPMKAVYTLRLFNPGQAAQTFRLTAGDSDGSCSYQFETPLLNVPSGSQASTLLHVTPLQYLDRGEIIHTFAVTAQPAGNASPTIRSEGRFVQGAVQRIGLALSPTSQTSPGPAAFSVVVSNPRSTPLQIELRPYDTGNLCQFVIKPSALSVPPLSQAAARLEVHPISELLPGETRRVCAFGVAGYPADMPNPVVVEGSLLVVHGFTWRRLLPFLIAAVIFLGIGGLVALTLLYINFIR